MVAGGLARGLRRRADSGDGKRFAPNATTGFTVSRLQCLERLAGRQSGHGALLTPTCLRLEASGDVTRLPGFDAGMWWVQDISAALAAPLLRPEAQADILDLCAAPGGKTLQLAAYGAQVTALDTSQSRLERLTANLARTGLGAQTLLADLESWNPTRRFSRVLLDAPARPPVQFAATPICLCTAAAVTLKKAHTCSPPSWSGRLTRQPPAVRLFTACAHWSPKKARAWHGRFSQAVTIFTSCRSGWMKCRNVCPWQ